ncbi:ribosome hibernation-promoting factor, HPF/YfiA family [Piscibacillus halophilus]|uniref:Ribosome hibernation promoting factor n=1 Tax=Piscibacillus halophilus TaxID=571933 RepID=A0A1H9EGM0_9BACI|nr:ribosome-associated translation inhibitor RaiA [Piscibacillus halophilus]SEQ24906.1 SSU ribosomal protein S30P /sigma 54 modulation protein [Piscibacillus halophilus]
MIYNVRGENIEVTNAIREYVEKKIGKLERYFGTPPSSEVHVNLSVHNDEQRIEVTIPMTDLLLRAEESNNDLYAATDLVVDKLERQIRKYKTKINRKFRQMGAPKHVFAELEREAAVAVNEETEDNDIQIVKKKRFDLKPMDEEEAVLQMDMLGHNFFVFENAETGETNVVYKRNDGKYGLIET